MAFVFGELEPNYFVNKCGGEMLTLLLDKFGLLLSIKRQVYSNKSENDHSEGQSNFGYSECYLDLWNLVIKCN